VSRPAITLLSAGVQSWDALVNDNLVALGAGATPMLVPEESDEGNLPAASSYDRCVIAVEDDDLPGNGYRLFFSNGTDWLPIPLEAAGQADIAGAGDLSKDDFNTFLQKLRDAGVIDPSVT